MPKLWELAALYLALIVAGAILATPTYPAEPRLGALAAIVGGALFMSRRRGRPRD